MCFLLKKMFWFDWTLTSFFFQESKRLRKPEHLRISKTSGRKSVEQKTKKWDGCAIEKDQPQSILYTHLLFSTDLVLVALILKPIRSLTFKWRPSPPPAGSSECFPPPRIEKLLVEAAHNDWVGPRKRRGQAKVRSIFANHFFGKKNTFFYVYWLERGFLEVFYPFWITRLELKTLGGRREPTSSRPFHPGPQCRTSMQQQGLGSLKDGLQTAAEVSPGSPKSTGLVNGKSQKLSGL